MKRTCFRIIYVSLDDFYLRYSSSTLSVSCVHCMSCSEFPWVDHVVRIQSEYRDTGTENHFLRHKLEKETESGVLGARVWQIYKRIFQCSNIFYTNIYLDIHSYNFFHTNIFGYFFVPFSSYKYIWIFVPIVSIK